MADDTLELHIPPYHNDRGACPKSMLEYEPDILTPEQQEQIHELKIATTRENNKYLGEHPEVNAIVSLITRAVFAQRPPEIREFIGNFVTRPTLTDEINEYLINELNAFPLPTDEELETKGQDEHGIDNSVASPEEQSEKEDQFPYTTYRKERTNRPSRVSFVGDKPTTREIYIDRLSDMEEEKILNKKHETASNFFGELLDAKYKVGADSRDVVSRSEVNSTFFEIDSRSSSGSQTVYQRRSSGSDHRPSHKHHAHRASALSRNHVTSPMNHVGVSVHDAEPAKRAPPLTMIFEKERTERSTSVFEKTFTEHRATGHTSSDKEVTEKKKNSSENHGNLRNNSMGSFKQEKMTNQPVSEVISIDSGGTYLPLHEDDVPHDAAKQPDNAVQQPENAAKEPENAE